MSPCLQSRFAALMSCVAVALFSSSCVQLERQGGPCSSDSDCAMGLSCKEMRCRSAADTPAPGLEPVMQGLRRAATKEAPRERDDVPPTLLEAVRTLGDGVEIDIYTNRHQPALVTLQGGVEYEAEAAAERLIKRVTGLAMEVPSVRLGKRMALSEERAVQERLHILRTETGVPIFVGAVVRLGVRREVIPAIRSAAHVDHALAAGLWRLHAKKEGRLRVGFVCTGGAFCPRVEPKPKAPGGADWGDEMVTALNDVFAPFDEVRQELMTELGENGIQPLALIAKQPVPDSVDVVALVGATQPLDSETRAWLLALKKQGKGVVMLLPGARMVASTGKLMSIEAGHAELLADLGLRRTDALLADRASLAKFKAPDRGATIGDLLPLVAEVARTSPFHPTVAGLYGLSLPFASTLQSTSPEGDTALAWSRPGVSPVTLPSVATNTALDSSAPPQPQGQERSIAVALEKSGEGRAVVIGSSLAIVSMSAPELIKNLDRQALSSQQVEFVRRLLPFAAAARAYRSTHRGNRALRSSTLRFLEQVAYWVAEPAKIRELAP
ncbi:MAG: hypothetical protein ACPGU1_16275 [Myxococcota bacterium]